MDSNTATDSPRVGIILLNYNGRELLEQYLPSIIGLNYAKYRIVVVDNASSDNSVSFLHENYPDVTVVENDENLGFSGGNNVGAAAHPDADYLWFLNTDVRVEPDSLSRLVEHIEEAAETGVVGPRIHNMDAQETIQSVGYGLGPDYVPKPHDNGDVKPSDSDPRPVSYVSGSSLLIDRDVWDEIGGFDEDNFIFGDDTYLCLLAWIHGYRVEAVPESIVYHELGYSRDDIAAKVAFHHSRSRTRSFLKIMQPHSLLRGLPRYVFLLAQLIVADVVLRRSPKAAVYRFLGFFATFTDLSNLYQERHEIQQLRERDDEQFLI